MKVNFKKDKNEILLKYKLKKGEQYRVRNSRDIFSLAILKKPEPVSGITSYCEDGKHILFLDYDNVCKWIVEKEIEEISKTTNRFYLFTTKEKEVNGDRRWYAHRA